MLIQICYLVFLLILVVFFLLTFRYKKNLTENLNPKEHPLKVLYGTSFALLDFLKKLQEKLFPNQRKLNVKLRENLKRLYVGQNIDVLEYLVYGRRIAYAYTFLLLFAVIGLMYCFSITKEAEPVKTLSRSTEEENYNLYMETEEGETQTIDVTVPAKEYDFEEAFALFENYREDLISSMLADNSDAETIQSPLNFITSMDNDNLKISWEIENEELIEYTGEIHPENIAEQGAATTVTATLTIGEHTSRLIIPLVLVP